MHLSNNTCSIPPPAFTELPIFYVWGSDWHKSGFQGDRNLSPVLGARQAHHLSRTSLRTETVVWDYAQHHPPCGLIPPGGGAEESRTPTPTASSHHGLLMYWMTHSWRPFTPRQIGQHHQLVIMVIFALLFYRHDDGGSTKGKKREFKDLT